jgi:23S rRNA (adenine2503-C2)-methyltransferase
MDVIKNLQVPTGNILVVDGDKGKLECLSLGDYGKDINLKSDALGLSRNIEKVVHTNLLPLSEKWVCTISSQYGCSSYCKFCDCPKLGPGINATFNDLINQVFIVLDLHKDIKSSKRLNIHFARIGEPTWNRDVLEAAKWLKYNIDMDYNVHPVVSTMMPKYNEGLKSFIHDWMEIKNKLYNGNAGLQLSINSTNEDERDYMFSDSALSLDEIAEVMDNVIPVGRKITLNFAVANYQIDSNILLRYFDPDNYIIKLTPMHKTQSAIKFDIKTEGDYTTFYPYQKHEENLKEAGYDVLVFIASEEEDLSLITCGNAILSGSLPQVDFKEIV